MSKIIEDSIKVMSLGNRRHNAKVTEIRSVNDSVFEVSFELEKPMTIEAGQYVWVVLEMLEGSGIDREAFSVISPEGSARSITISSRATESNYKRALRSLPVGSKVTVYGPHGSAFCVDPNNQKTEYFFLAGGLGVTPFVGILRSLVKRGFQPKVNLVYFYSEKDGTSISYKSELDELAGSCQKFDIVYRRGSPTTSSLEKISNNVSSGTETCVFVSGPQGFVNSVSEIIPKADNKAFYKIKYEEIYPDNSSSKAVLEEIASNLHPVASGNKDDETVPTDYFDKIRDKVFRFLVLLSLVATLLLTWVNRDSGSFINRLNIVLITYFVFQTINILSFFKNKKMERSVNISTFLFSVGFIMYQILDSHRHLDRAWLLLPLLLIFFFYRLRQAIIYSISYIVIGIVLFIALSSTANIDTMIVDLVDSGLFIILSTATLVVFIGISNILQKSEDLIKGRFKAMDLLLKTIVNSPNHIIITDVNGKIIYGNSAASKNTGFSFNEMRGQTPRLWGGLNSPRYYSDLWERHKIGDIVNEVIVNRNKSGDLYCVKANIIKIAGYDNETIGFLATEDNITEIIPKTSE